MDLKKTCALVLGGHVNGYSIIRELDQQGIIDIFLLDQGRSVAKYSNKIKRSFQFDGSSIGLLEQLHRLNQNYAKIILFPTSDTHLENIQEIRKEIEHFCFIPFNTDNLELCLNKDYQYQICEKTQIPYPRSIKINKKEDLENAYKILKFPILIKPTKRKDLTTPLFRNLFIANQQDFKKQSSLIESYFDIAEFLASEFVPGDDTNIYAYTCYRSRNGEIQNEWSGKKLTQFPDNYGIACSASNEAPEEVNILGRRLVEALNIYGVCEPEFKYDRRDDSFKLMEVNLRSMMWHRVGSLSGVQLHQNQVCDAIGHPIENYTQNKITKVHFIIMLHEIANLISRPDYTKNFIYNIVKCDKRDFAIFQINDPLPFLASLYPLIKQSLLACRKRFETN